MSFSVHVYMTKREVVFVASENFVMCPKTVVWEEKGEGLKNFSTNPNRLLLYFQDIDERKIIAQTRRQAHFTLSSLNWPVA